MDTGDEWMRPHRGGANRHGSRQDAPANPAAPSRGRRVESARRNLHSGMIRLGTALKSNEPPFHRCLVIFNPSLPSQEVLRKVIAAARTDGGMPLVAKKLLAQI